MSDKKNVTIRLTHAQHEALVARAKELGIHVSAVVAVALDRELSGTAPRKDLPARNATG